MVRKICPWQVPGFPYAGLNPRRPVPSAGVETFLVVVVR